MHRGMAKINKYQRTSREMKWEQLQNTSQLICISSQRFREEMLCYNVCRHVLTSFCGYRCLAAVARMLSCAYKVSRVFRFRIVFGTIRSP